MRDTKRIKRILDNLKEIWEKCPDWRFGQLLINVGVIEDTYNSWSVEDDVTEKALEKFKEYQSKQK